MKNLNYLLDHILHQMFKIFLSISSKNINITDNYTIRINVNKTESRTTIKIKTQPILEFLTPETTKLLQSTKK